MKIKSYFLLGIFIVLLSSHVTSAHVPRFAKDGYSIDSAIKVEDPLKSWVFYSQLPDNSTVQYYTFQMQKDDRLKLSLLTPQRGDFVPGVVLTGPGIDEREDVPEYIDIPENSGAWSIEGKMPERASYEAFTPSKHYTLLDIDTTAPATGQYYVAVYSTTAGGEYALGIGYTESFKLTEWITVPAYTIKIHLWEGQSVFSIFAPLVATLLAGLVIVFKRQKNLSYFAIAGIIAGLFYIGSAAMKLYQMMIAMEGTSADPSIALTTSFIIVSATLGIILLKLSLKDTIGTTERSLMLLIGIAGLFTWSGVFIGPAIAIMAAIIPADLHL